MKNKDLIEELKKYNLDADVTLTTSEDIFISYISENIDGDTLNKQTTMQLFIEGKDFCEECVHEYIHEFYDVKWCNYYDAPCIDVMKCEQYEEFYEV